MEACIHGTVVANTDFVGVFLCFFSKLQKIPHISSAIEISYIMEVANMENKKVMRDDKKENIEFQKVANKVSIVTIIGNLVLSVLKFLAGVIAHSSAMISDAIHSASDVFSTFVVIVGIKLSSKKPDKEHPYGHERLECVAAIVLAIVLFITGLGIGMDALEKIIQGN